MGVPEYKSTRGYVLSCDTAVQLYLGTRVLLGYERPHMYYSCTRVLQLYASTTAVREYYILGGAIDPPCTCPKRQNK